LLLKILGVFNLIFIRNSSLILVFSMIGIVDNVVFSLLVFDHSLF
jgi:hypothetical protein